MAIAQAAVRAGISVLKPLGDERYDFVFDLKKRFVRVQCKTAVVRMPVVTVSCRTCRRTADGYLRRTYDETEIDAFAAYCADLDRSFFLPLSKFDARTAIQLRLEPTRNNQQLRVNWADDFDFEHLDWESLGP